ncbi:hypothetical protein ABIB25_000681 [Nakamurella sp. UYEF19]|uniref:hypothetical protein n=1 Tax=Nakamurella sp. UYEF19 TaxID=1756392 RepID=UPI0033967181
MTMRIPTAAPVRPASMALTGLVAVAVLLAGCAAPAEVGPEHGTAASTPVVGSTIRDTPSATPSLVLPSPTLPSPTLSSPNLPSSVALSPAPDQSGPAETRRAESTPKASVPLSPATGSPAVASPLPRVFGTKAAPIPVEVTGMVLADAKGKVVMCPPFPVAAVGTVSSEIPTPDCQRPVPVNGVDLALVTDPGHNSTHRWGRTHVEATWNGTDLTVRSQRLPTDADRDPTEMLPDDVACPAPAGGWTLGATQDDPGVGKIEAAVGAGFGSQAMGYPHGGPTNTDGKNPSYSLDHTEQVLVVGTTGDIDQATAAIRKVFTGNLCVVKSTTTGAEIKQQNQKILAALGDDWSAKGVMSTGDRMIVLGTTTNQIDVIVDTPALAKILAGIPGPPITVNTWITPVR